jgi:hypothetical protein
VTASVLAATVAAAAATWRAIPWRATHAVLRTTKEELPAHGRMASVWWSDEGWAVAVGAEGEVLVRDEGPPVTTSTDWRALPRVTRGDLSVVAGDRLGDWEHALAAGDGALLDCTPAACWLLAHEGHLRAIATGGGEALVLGDGGVVYRVVPWFTDRSVPFPEHVGSWLRADRIADLDVVTDFRAVDLACTTDDGLDRCDATLTGADGVRVHGVRTGTCDNGTRPSGSQMYSCRWEWRLGERGPAPVTSPLRVWSPVVVVRTKLTATREERDREAVILGPSPALEAHGSLLPLRVERRFVSASMQYGDLGEATLLVDEGGDVFIAR